MKKYSLLVEFAITFCFFAGEYACPVCGVAFWMLGNCSFCYAKKQLG